MYNIGRNMKGTAEKPDLRYPGCCQIEVVHNLDFTQPLDDVANVKKCDCEAGSVSQTLLTVSASNILPKTVLDLYLPTREKVGNEVKQPQENDNEAGNVQLGDGLETPLVVFVHGGGWRRGHKQGWDHYLSKYDTNFLVYFLLRWFNVYDNIGESLARQGMACAVLTYPLSTLRLPWNLLEIFTSFLSSIGCLGVIISPLLITVKLVCKFFPKIFYIPTHSYFIFALGLTQAIVWLTMCCRKKFYGLPIRIVLLQLLSIGIFIGILLIAMPTAGKILRTLHWLSVMMTIISQGTIIYLHVTLPSATYEDQIHSLVKSTQWLKEYGSQTKHFNPHFVYLMGHSAGGHLVTMATIHSVLGNRKKTIHGIQGVISISGVYDLLGLARGILSHLYVTPTFGSDQQSWRAASPLHCLQDMDKASKSRKGSAIEDQDTIKLPPFFLISAKWDFSLLQQSHDFAEELCRKGVGVDRLIVKRTDHFTITACFGGKESLERKCAQFVCKTMELSE